MKQNNKQPAPSATASAPKPNKTTTPQPDTRGAPTGNANARKGPENFNAILHCRCYAEEKSAWIAAAKRSPQGKLTTWARDILNHHTKNPLDTPPPTP
jgi:hypothetical protein